MNEVINQQNVVELNSDSFKTFADTASIVICPKQCVSVSFVSDVKMKALNLEFRGKGSTTDVLSFPFVSDEFEPVQNFLGDIVISAEQAAHQAEENGLSFELEVKQLILHGILHLCGYDHETDNGEMNALELQFRDKLGVS